MTSKDRTTTLIAVSPALMAPVIITLARYDQADFLLGLSSDFWAGTLIGLSISAALFAITRISRSRSAG
jgi:hypothetical protein